jgi:outer membrane protein assembly factor BamB
MRRLITRVVLGSVTALSLLPLHGVAASADWSSASPSSASIELPDGFAPEDMAAGRGSSFYVASFGGEAGVYAGDFRTGQGDVIVPGQPGRTDVGVFVDKRDRLWVTGGTGGDVRVYDATDGTPLASYALAGPGGFLSDVVVTDDAAYVTDSFEPNLYVIPLGGGRGLPDQEAARAVRLTGDISYTTEPFGFNANGIVEKGGRLVVGQTNTGKLFTVDPATGATREIDLRGGNVFGADGIDLRGNTLYVSENFPQSVSVVKLDGDLASGRVVRRVTDSRFDIPTAVVRFGDGLYALNSRITTPVTPDLAYTVVRVDAR